MIKQIKHIVAAIALASTSVVASAAVVSIGNVTGNYTLNTNGATASQSAIESFLGLSNGALDALGQGNAVEGSAIKDSHSVSAGSTLSFSWNWTSAEVFQSAFNDFAFITINIGGTTVIANTFTPDGTSGLFSYVAPTSGTLTYGIGIMDEGDSSVSSVLTVSNLQISTNNVPEPGTLALAGLALGALSLRRRKN